METVEEWFGKEAEMIDHLSYSSIQNYLMCQRHWRYRYIDQIKSEKNDALLFGSAWHKMINLVAGTLQPIDEAFLESLDTSMQSEENYHALSRMSESTPIKAHLQGLEIKQSELKFELTIPQSELPIIGYIDAILEDGTPVDFKTSKRKWSQAQADKDLQATFYIAGMHKMGMIQTSDFPIKFEYHIFTKTKNPDVQVLETWRTVEDVLGLFNLIGVVSDSMRAGQHVPNPTTWKCSSNYCEFWELCKGGMK